MSSSDHTKETVRQLLIEVCKFAEDHRQVEPSRWLSYYTLKVAGDQHEWLQEGKDSFSFLGRIFLNSSRLLLGKVVHAFTTDEEIKKKLLLEAWRVMAFMPPLSETSMWIWDMVVVPYLEVSFKKFNRLSFDETTFEQYYRPMIDSIIQLDPLKIIYVSPLRDISFSVDEIELSDNVKLRKATSSELEVWVNGDDLFLEHTVDQMEVAGIKWVIETTYRISEDLVGQKFDWYSTRKESRIKELESRRRVINVLRLQSGLPLDTAFTHASARGIFIRQKSLNLPAVRRGIVSNIPTFDGGEGVEIKKLWTKVSNSPNSTMLEMPIRRWSDSFDRFNDEDRLVDLWIALEALLAPELDTEIRFRLGLRGATLIGEDPKMKQEIYNHFLHSYLWRSAIVHGNEDKRRKLEKNSSLKATIAETRKYTHNVILKILGLKERFHAVGLDKTFFLGSEPAIKD